MRDLIPPAILLAASGTGIVLAGLVVWHALGAIARLLSAVPTRETVALLLSRLAAASRAGRPWEPELRSLRLQLPWPWPWRLSAAADRLAAGIPSDQVLAGSLLLPAVLRPQAAQALRQGPEAFAGWCEAVAPREATSLLAVRQQAFLITEAIGLVAALWFLIVFIAPKFVYICSDLGLPAPAALHAAAALQDWWLTIIGVTVVLAMAAWSALLARAWRRHRRLAAARLLLAGASARLPEAALGTAGGFPALCRAAGWRADDPAQLARALARAETREALRAAWLPALLAAAAPLAAAIPVGLVVIGIMHLLISILTGLEPPP